MFLEQPADQLFIFVQGGTCKNTSRDHLTWQCGRSYHTCDEGLMKLAGDPNWHWNVLQFQLEKWPQGREIQVRLCSLACAIIQIFSPDRSLLIFKTLQHPLFLRWVSPRSFNLRDLYRSLFLWPLDLVLTRWIGKNRLERPKCAGSHACPWSSLAQSVCSYSGRRLQR